MQSGNATGYAAADNNNVVPFGSPFSSCTAL
jgi:hypothetical protein